jgi:hypothetical protein
MACCSGVREKRGLSVSAAFTNEAARQLPSKHDLTNVFMF